METDTTLRSLTAAGAGLSAPTAGFSLPPSLHRLGSVRLLSLDAHGRVLDWINWQDAACLYARGAVAWTLGDPCLTLHGGWNRQIGEQSLLQLHPIIAARGHVRPAAIAPTPALTNQALFARDQHLCLYCGREFSRHALTRDHVQPVSRGGRDVWENVVTACGSCNLLKGSRLPQECRMIPRLTPAQPSTWQLQENGRAFPPNYLHESWRDYLYWDIELES